jgi:hypothetical protein
MVKQLPPLSSSLSSHFQKISSLFPAPVPAISLVVDKPNPPSTSIPSTLVSAHETALTPHLHNEALVVFLISHCGEFSDSPDRPAKFHLSDFSTIGLGPGCYCATTESLDFYSRGDFLPFLLFTPEETSMLPSALDDELYFELS